MLRGLEYNQKRPLENDKSATDRNGLPLKPGDKVVFNGEVLKLIWDEGVGLCAAYKEDNPRILIDLPNVNARDVYLVDESPTAAHKNLN